MDDANQIRKQEVEAKRMDAILALARAVERLAEGLSAPTVSIRECNFTVAKDASGPAISIGE